MNMQIDLIERPTITRASEAARRMREAQARAQRGMDQAESSAERSAPGWCALAAERLRMFARSQGGVFSIEQARVCLQDTLPMPPDLRAFGKATVMALKADYIERVRGVFLPAASSNGAPKAAYRKGKKA